MLFSYLWRLLACRSFVVVLHDGGNHSAEFVVLVLLEVDVVALREFLDNRIWKNLSQVCRLEHLWVVTGIVVLHPDDVKIFGHNGRLVVFLVNSFQ